MTAREPVEGWEPYRAGAELEFIETMDVGVQEVTPGEWEAYGCGVSAGPLDTENEAKLLAEDHAARELIRAAIKLRPDLTQLKAALDALETEK